MQAAGAYTSRPWIPVVSVALLFGLAHGLAQGTWLFVDRVAFGLAAGWLAIRTGGLEAPIGLHLAGNLFAFMAVAVTGEFESSLTAPEESVGPGAVAIDLAAVAIVAIWIYSPRRS
jgi:membrane protease YdiL (CAAX protease family)